MSIFKDEVPKKSQQSMDLSPQELADAKRIFREIFTACKRNGVVSEALVQMLKQEITISVKQDTKYFKF